MTATPMTTGRLVKMLQHLSPDITVIFQDLQGNRHDIRDANVTWAPCSLSDYRGVQPEFCEVRLLSVPTTAIDNEPVPT